MILLLIRLWEGIKAVLTYFAEKKWRCVFCFVCFFFFFKVEAPGGIFWYVLHKQVVQRRSGPNQIGMG